MTTTIKQQHPLTVASLLTVEIIRSTFWLSMGIIIARLDPYQCAISCLGMFGLNLIYTILIAIVGNQSIREGKGSSTNLVNAVALRIAAMYSWIILAVLCFIIHLLH